MKKWRKYLALFLTVTMCTATVGFECRAEEVSTDGVFEENVLDSTEQETDAGEQTTDEENEETDAIEQTTDAAEQEPDALEQVMDSETQENAEDTAEEEIQESVIDTETSQQINYVYVESPEITAGNTQNIVFSVGGEENVLSDGGKLFFTAPDGEEREAAVSKQEGKLLLFEIPVENTDLTGEYTLHALEYTADGQLYTETLEDTWNYTVTDQAMAALQTYAAEAPEDGVIASDEAISENSLDEALSSLDTIAEAAGVTVDVAHYDRNSSGDLVVVLDPGHDATHSGAIRGKLKEQDITLSLAWYAKDALEQYSGVKVYMTREGDGCPVGGKSNKECLEYRTSYAASVHADLFVSFHINSTTHTTISSSGAMVFVPNYSKYNGTMSSLAKKILNELHALGLKNNGVEVRKSGDNEYYDDGNRQDYYSVIRNSVLKGFPGILIEHAFINNTGDQMILASESMLKKLGTGDAEAIAKHYGLTKGLTEAQKEQIRKFVNRMYEKVMNRGYDQDGQKYWSDLLINQKISGAYLAEKFVFSPEFENRKLDNNAFLQVLYATFFDRAADAEGLAYWNSVMAQGVSRKGVCGRFVMSQEFTNICNNYGITKGSFTYTEERDKNPDVTAFVYRCYNKTLDRDPETEGLNYWTGVINNKKASAKSVAGKFVFSQEFKNKKLNDTEYVKVLYRVFMGREYDAEGLKYWTGKLASGSSRESIFESFANAKEFSLILKSFGL